MIRWKPRLLSVPYLHLVTGLWYARVIDCVDGSTRHVTHHYPTKHEAVAAANCWVHNQHQKR